MNSLFVVVEVIKLISNRIGDTRGRAIIGLLAGFIIMISIAWYTLEGSHLI